MFGLSSFPFRNTNTIRSSRFYCRHYLLPSLPFMQSLLTPSTYYFISTVVFHLYINSNKSIVTSAFATTFRHFHHSTFISSTLNNKGSLSMTSTSTPPSSSTTTSSSDDPYTHLEDVESESSLQFARDANDKCLSELGNPEKSGTGTYDKVLTVLESDERIPHVVKFGVNDEGDMVLFNFWKEGTNPKGLWRSTTLSSYRTPSPTWTTILSIDTLGQTENVSWVWKGSTPLPRSRDPLHSSTHVTRALIKLSNGGADAITLREFDLPSGAFVEEDGFNLPKEAKTRASYRSRDVLSIASDFGEGSLTDSGYPRTVREWVRGTNLDEAPVVFEGEKSDVSVGAYVDDQRHRGGWIYDVRYRHLDFYRSKTWVRRVCFEMLLAEDDPMRMAVGEKEEEFVELDVQEDASVDFFGKLMFISIKSDWEVGGMTYKIGSLLIVNYDDFMTKGKDACSFRVLFSPTERTALESYAETKNYLVLEIMDNVKSRLVFYKHDEDTGDLTPVYGLNEDAQIRSSHIGALDPRDNDLFWFTTSEYTQPSTLYLADAAVFDNNDDTTTTNGDTPKTDPFILEKLKSLPPQYDSSNISTIQRFATSADGTKIPYFLIYNKNNGFEKGCTPTMLYGYGGFEISLTAHYTGTSGVAWLERGGAYVEANIRGGGEFGPKWHQAALKDKRNKSYEDFIAVAEDLISSGLCTPQTLATRGGSNGGLLMGNMLTMRPDLFGAIHCAVPLLDMKKYHKLLAGASWMAEYGDPDTDDWESFLKTYSPYHNLKSDVDYPPILFTTSTRDDRVHPAHARKMVKKMWDMDEGRGRWKVHYYENIEGGHGGAADSKQSAFMTALAFDFCWNTLTKNNKE